MNYGFSCINWAYDEKETLAGALHVKLGIPMKRDDMDNGKSPYLEIDRTLQGVRIRRLTHLSKEKQDEIVKDANKIYEASLQQFKINAGGIRTCVLCNKNFESMGNNPKPLSEEGRCCDDCNNKKVIPARISKLPQDEQTKILNSNLSARGITTLLTPMKDVGKIKLGRELQIPVTHAVIQDNDRLREYQILKRNIELRFEQKEIGAEDYLKESMMGMVRGMWRSAYKPSFNNAKVWNIDDEQVPIIFHTDSKFDEHLPFPSIVLNATIPIKQRIYYGVFVGSFYTEEYHYRLLFTTFSEVYKKNKHADEETIWGVDIFPLDSVAFEDFSVEELDYYQKKLRNFVFSFCNYTYHPEVTTIEMPYNPKNNERRIARGIIPLPAYRRVVVRGNLQIYISRTAEKVARIRRHGLREYWVRGTYYHFKNKQRFRRIYALPQELLDRKEYIVRDGFICKFVKPKCVNRGMTKVVQEWDVK